MNVAVIVAAGSSSRMGGIDKMFIEIAGKPLIAHTLQRFDISNSIDLIVLVVRKENQNKFQSVVSGLRLNTKIMIVEGGEERQDSVWNGLNAFPFQSQVVLIHDGARPCTHTKIIKELIIAANEYGAAVPATKITDTLKESNNGITITKTVDRSLLWAVQTPQAFKPKIILKALKKIKECGVIVTDDAAACEFINQPVRLIECKWPNPKVTYPHDIPYIEWLLTQQNQDINV